MSANNRISVVGKRLRLCLVRYFAKVFAWFAK